MSKSAFHQVKAALDVVRYEEVDRLFKEVYQLEKDIQSKSSLRDEVWWHKHADRQLTHEEVYRRALDDVMNLLDERMGVLSAS